MKEKTPFINPLFVLLFLSILPFSLVSAADDNLIQTAILLDASNSMDGLIEQAKMQLWKIVNTLALMKRDGKSPQIEVAFYEYGNDGIAQTQGHIKQLVPFTRDLDKVSEELSAIRTNGGQEYCGQAIERAVEELSWAPGSNVLKQIFIAGNEPFTQGAVNYETACKNAVSKGICINTIFCGTQQEGINTKWKHAADCADGTYMNINQEQAVVYTPAPQDSAINSLGMLLNDTYLSYGSSGGAAKKRQSTQDHATLSASREVMVQRSLAKSSSQYENSSWDLVDAAAKKGVAIEKLQKEELPPEMQSMSAAEQQQYIEKKSQERQQLQKKIAALNEERMKYLAQQKKSDRSVTLETAIINALQRQAQVKGFSFDKKAGN